MRATARRENGTLKHDVEIRQHTLVAAEGAADETEAKAE